MSQPLPVHELGDKCDILHKEHGNELMIEKLQYCKEVHLSIIVYFTMIYSDFYNFFAWYIVLTVSGSTDRLPLLSAVTDTNS